MVVANDQDQYAIWPAELELPDGWRAEGTRGDEQECLRHIDATWTDMRPRDLRERMARAEGQR
ncbi:MbtH family protein [Streptomyces sp. NPDC091972]|uniref:MbtH family protein n=1 Tax=unclassified Streptomyces TaxID=2593676 RepID=UPI0006B32FE0|nr:MbtH family NRPS accessory protein [Streptomyces sp. NRRL B-24085]